MKIIRVYTAVLLIAATIIGAVGCTTPVKAADLMSNISPNNVSGKPPDTEFTVGMADFSIELFKQSIANKENSLISPLSVMLALAMTANGADSETLAQMEWVLCGSISINELNEYLYYFTNNLSNNNKAKLSIANSIWFRATEDLDVRSGFLQKNADYYGAAAQKTAFDEKALSDINNWVNTKTDGMIKKILDSIDAADMLYLINAIVFEAEWHKIYEENRIRESTFTDIFGNKQRVDFMYSTEWRYLEDNKATGFIKPYSGSRYSFAALLPNEDVPLNEFIESLTGAGLLKIFHSAQVVEVRASMPKFEYEYNTEMSPALKALGMTDAFSAKNADFSRMGVSKAGGLYISRVIHKTFIKVDERGTKAGAATAVAAAPGAAPGQVEVQYKVVNLDRPFVFAIIDSSEPGLPVFIGTVLSVG